VREVIETVRKISNREILSVDSPRRAGTLPGWWPVQKRLEKNWDGLPTSLIWKRLLRPPGNGTKTIPEVR